MCFKSIIEELCRKKVWLFCGFLYTDSSMLHKYLVVVAESYQYLGGILLDCLDDKECSETLALMIRYTVLIKNYAPNIDVDEVARIFREVLRRTS